MGTCRSTTKAISCQQFLGHNLKAAGSLCMRHKTTFGLVWCSCLGEDLEKNYFFSISLVYRSGSV